MLRESPRARRAPQKTWRLFAGASIAVAAVIGTLISVGSRPEEQGSRQVQQAPKPGTSIGTITEAPVQSSGSSRESAEAGVVPPSGGAPPDQALTIEAEKDRAHRKIRREKLSAARDEFVASRAPQKALMLECLTIATLIEEYGCGTISDASTGFKPKRRRRPDDSWSFLLDGRAFEFEDIRFPEFGCIMRALGSEPENDAERKRREVDSRQQSEWFTEEAAAQVLARADEAIGVLL